MRTVKRIYENIIAEDSLADSLTITACWQNVSGTCILHGCGSSVSCMISVSADVDENGVGLLAWLLTHDRLHCRQLPCVLYPDCVMRSPFKQEAVLLCMGRHNKQSWVFVTLRRRRNGNLILIVASLTMTKKIALPLSEEMTSY